MKTMTTLAHHLEEADRLLAPYDRHRPNGSCGRLARLALANARDHVAIALEAVRHLSDLQKSPGTRSAEELAEFERMLAEVDRG